MNNGVIATMWSRLCIIGLVVGSVATIAHCTPTDPPTVAPAGSAPGATSPIIDASAIALLKKVGTTMIGLTSYQAECWTTTTFDPGTAGKKQANRYEMSTLTSVNPNLLRYDLWDMQTDAAGAWARKNESPRRTFVSDGKTRWEQMETTYWIDKRIGVGLPGFEPSIGFYGAHSFPYDEIPYYLKGGSKLLEVRAAGSEPVDDIPCEKVYLHGTTVYAGVVKDCRTTWFIDASGLVRRKVDAISFGGKDGYTRDAVLRAIKTNVPITRGSPLFTYKPPPGVYSDDDLAKQKLLANGVAAPDFTFTDENRKIIKLSSLRGHVVVIDFWASWCGPCKAAMPHNQKVIEKLRAKGVPVTLLAVDYSELQTTFRTWVKTHGEFHSLTFGYADPKVSEPIEKSYRITGIPTQYVIDSQGIIRASFFGYNGPTDDLENAVRGALKNK